MGSVQNNCVDYCWIIISIVIIDDLVNESDYIIIGY